MKTRNPVLYVEGERLRALGEALEEADRAELRQAEPGVAGLAHVTEGLVSLGLRVPEGLRITSEAWPIGALTTSPERRIPSP